MVDLRAANYVGMGNWVDQTGDAFPFSYVWCDT